MEKVNDNLTMAVRADSLTMWLQLYRIRPSRWQARERFEVEALADLAASIAQHGLINPVIVFEHDGYDGNGGYELVAGERRTRAAVALTMAELFPQHSLEDWVARLANVGLLGLGAEERKALEQSNAAIPAQVRWPPADEDELRALHLVAVLENIEHADLSPIEEAKGFQALADEYGWTQRQLAEALGKSQSYVGQRLSLLGLTPAAEEALSTRVLNTSHARAIARVPEPLQPAVTQWAIDAVQRDDSPATTRQVETFARAVAAFVDPNRWEPNPERVYRPEERNRLAVIQWAVERVDLPERVDALMGLEAVRRYGGAKNLLTTQAINVARELELTLMVLTALGWNQGIDAALLELGRTCASCAAQAYVDETGAPEPFRGSTWCPKWEGETRETCPNYIGPVDPVVIPVSWKVRDWVQTHRPRALHESDIGTIMTSVADYVEAFRQASAEYREQEAARQEQQAQRHLVGIAAYQSWQAEQPAEDLEHFQAHACHKCAAYLADAPHCVYGVEPFQDTFDKVPRPPYFAVWVAEDGRVLPRCQGFCYQTIPVLHATDVEFGDRDVAIEWLNSLARTEVHSRALAGIWGILRWVDYAKGQRNDLSALCRYVRREWDSLGGSPAVATLLRAAAGEVDAVEKRRAGVARVWNPTTDRVEEFAVLEVFDVLLDEQGTYRYKWIRENWPDGFPWPLPEPEEDDADPDDSVADSGVDQ